METTEEQIRQHYLIEKELANRLLNSTKTERSHLYTELYDELFRRVPYHSQLKYKSDDTSKDNARRQLRLIKKLLTPQIRFMEIGPGDCKFALLAASMVNSVAVIDVSNEVTKNIKGPSNFHLIISDGSDINVPSGTVDMAYSNQLIEHLHPDDVTDHLKSVYDALTFEGIYVCCTPNRLSGPHDISGQFDDVATGFHLREYTYTDLNRMFQNTGFRRIKCYVGGRGYYLRIPVTMLKAYEKAVSVLPRDIIRRLRRNMAFEASLNIHIMGIK